METTEDFTYPKSSENAINRHKERGHYDATTVHSIINTTTVAHVSFNPPNSPFPITLPMICRIAQYITDSEPHAYIHGYITSRLMKLPSEPSEVGLPLSICATKVDGLVLALTPFNHSYNYRSALLQGHASLIDPAASPDENTWALRLITDGIVPQRWDNTRAPDAADIKSTRILKVRIAHASAKVRDIGVSDEKKDLRREEVTGKYWTGVVPVWEQLGAPVPAETNVVSTVPSYISEYVGEHNARVKAEARSVAGPETEEERREKEGKEKGFLGRVFGS